MCKSGVACSYNNDQGRVENIRVNRVRNQIVGDFIGRDSRGSTFVEIRSIIPLHKKAEKQLAEIMEPLKAHLQPESKVAV